jgi:hypothetical protein
MRAYSSGFRPCAATSSGVMLGSLFKSALRDRHLLAAGVSEGNDSGNLDSRPNCVYRIV